MPVRTVGPKGGGFGGGPITSIGGMRECQRPRTGVDCDVPHWLGGEQTTLLDVCNSPSSLLATIVVFVLSLLGFGSWFLKGVC